MASMLMKIEGVDGESQTTGYEGWIEIDSFALSSSAPPSTELGGGSGVGKPTVHGVSCTTTAGRHTPQINAKYFNGEHFGQVEIVFLKQTGNTSPEKYYHLTMDHVFFSSISNSKAEGALGSEALTLMAEVYTQEYFAQAKDGSLTSVGSTSYNTKTQMTA